MNNVLKRALECNSDGVNILALTLKAKKLHSYPLYLIEETISDTILWAYERCKVDKKFEKTLSTNTLVFKVHKECQRKWFKEWGYNQRGNKYGIKKDKYGNMIDPGHKAPWVGNNYDADGDNMIESIGYDEDGQLIIENKGSI